MNAAGIIITFEPNLAAIESVIGNISILERVFIIDNSVNSDISDLFAEMPNVTFIRLGQNLGVGQALNTGCILAMSEGYEWFVTLDQDSKLPVDYLTKMKRVLGSLDSDSIGIISPIHTHNTYPIEREADLTKEFMEVSSVMMSGNLVSLAAFLRSGGYREDFFIDYIDIEFCMRLRRNGFKIYLCPVIVLDHQLGLSRWIKIGIFIIKPTHHSFSRRYYISRNRIYMMRYEYSGDVRFIISDSLRFFKETVYIILYEDSKLKKLESIYLGLVDGLNGKLGKRDFE